MKIANDVVAKLYQQNCCEHFYTEHPDFDFVCVAWADNEETCKALQAMMVATGKVKKVLFTRAWSSQDWQEISKKASSLVGTYVAPSDAKKD